MDRLGVRADSSIYAYLLQGCVKMKALEEGKRVHAHIIRSGFETDTYIANRLVNMYSKCGCLVDARKVFDKKARRDVVTWNAIMAGYVQHGYGEEALKLLCKMDGTGMKPNQVTFASVLGACASMAALEEGKQVHARIRKTGFESDVFLESTLVDVYAKCGSLEDARQVFDKMISPNVVSRSSMIAGYARNELWKEAFQLFEQMHQAAIIGNQFTFTSILSACINPEALKPGKQVHAYIIKTGFEIDVSVGNALITMYAKCGSIETARQVFDEMPIQAFVSWNAIVAGYSLNGLGEAALELFWEGQSAGMKPNEFTFSSIVRACTSVEDLEQGKQVHAHIFRTGFELDKFVGSSLLDLYLKCGKVENARQVFVKMPKRDTVLWTAMIAGFAQHGQGEDALNFFHQMQRAGEKPNQFTFTSVFRACASLAALEQGKQIHTHTIKTGIESDVFVGSALLDMYAKCGTIEDSHLVFNTLPDRNVVSWTAMIAGYAQHGCGKEALQLFGQMQREDMKPNHITFVGVLCACNHVGLVEEARHYFNSMSGIHNITPRLEHYACMVDLLGRAGHLDEAEDFIHQMSLKPGALVWQTLLGACRIYGNIEVGKRVGECLLELEPQDPATYVLLSNMYASARRWDEVAKVRKLMKERGVKKEPGCSWIEIKNSFHAFVVDDRSHPQTENIYAMLERLSGQMKEAGYVPDTNFVLHNVEQEQKEHSLGHHSEKLAIAFGLISTHPGMQTASIILSKACVPVGIIGDEITSGVNVCIIALLRLVSTAIQCLNGYQKSKNVGPIGPHFEVKQHEDNPGPVLIEDMKGSHSSTKFCGWWRVGCLSENLEEGSYSGGRLGLSLAADRESINWLCKVVIISRSCPEELALEHPSQECDTTKDAWQKVFNCTVVCIQCKSHFWDTNLKMMVCIWGCHPEEGMAQPIHSIVREQWSHNFLREPCQPLGFATDSQLFLSYSGCTLGLSPADGQEELTLEHHWLECNTVEGTFHGHFSMQTAKPFGLPGGIPT
eukprot:Gb_03512 [translate_table: standard]